MPPFVECVGAKSPRLCRSFEHLVATGRLVQGAGRAEGCGSRRGSPRNSLNNHVVACNVTLFVHSVKRNRKSRGVPLEPISQTTGNGHCFGNSGVVRPFHESSSDELHSNGSPCQTSSSRRFVSVLSSRSLQVHRIASGLFLGAADSMTGVPDHGRSHDAVCCFSFRSADGIAGFYASWMQLFSIRRNRR